MIFGVDFGSLTPSFNASWTSSSLAAATKPRAGQIAAETGDDGG